VWAAIDDIEQRGSSIEDAWARHEVRDPYTVASASSV
jgi:hypothetical protein